ncbi:MAG: TolC family outer membrane protein [Rhodocyclaceae bacterium]
MHPIKKALCATLAAALPALCFPVASSAWAGPTDVPDALRGAVQQAVGANPEIQARWHAFQAAVHEQDVLRGGLRPQVDVSAAVGRQFEKLQGQPSTDFNRFGASLTLTQMLYDGMFTRSEVSRFGHARMVRYYELMSDAEAVALEAVRAYLDVLRYRELVVYAQENYAAHKLVHEQIVERTRSGVGRGVDLELATGRLALAESNLLTEVSNLHDVSARYARIVGELPPDALGPMSAEVLRGTLPAGVEAALSQAFQLNPGLKAAVADIRAGQDLVETRRAAHRPRVDLRLRQDYDRNLDRGGVYEREGAIELVLNYNLYRGGADEARLRQAAETLNASRDVREKVCRDIRQTVSIAMNDVSSLEAQLRHLDQHQLSMSKARQAYRQQFDIGQRTLLDLLDGENEYFDARRAYTNAAYNQMLAQARSLSGMGALLPALGVVRDGLPTEAELAGQETYLDAEAACPPLAPVAAVPDREAVLAEAMRRARQP